MKVGQANAADKKKTVAWQSNASTVNAETSFATSRVNRIDEDANSSMANVQVATVGRADAGPNAAAADVNGTRQKKKEDKERRAFIILTYVILSYLVCWVPFHVVFDISAVDPSLVPDFVYRSTFWLTYFNSTLNPVLYAYSSPDFRRAFKRILSCQWSLKSKPIF